MEQLLSLVGDEAAGGFDDRKRFGRLARSNPVCKAGILCYHRGANLDDRRGLHQQPGTIPSKALCKAILQLTGMRGRFYHEPAPTVDNNITIQELVSQCQHTIRAEQRVILEHFRRNGIAVLWGNAFFEDLHTVRVAYATGSELVQAQAIILAVGTVPAHSPHILFDDRQVVDSDSFLRMPSLPRSLIIVGGRGYWHRVRLHAERTRRASHPCGGALAPAGLRR